MNRGKHPQDHRGQRVELAEPKALHDAGVDIKRLQLPNPRSIWDRESMNSEVPPLAAAAFIVVIFAGNLFWVFSESMGLPSWLGLQACLVMVIAASFVFGKHSWSRLGQKYSQRLINAGYCPSCAFSLDGLAVEDDGCVVCPECGAAWKHTISN